ncbi:MAG: glutamine--fructose-6-phosphate aminotransferase, partial [Bacillota bacterium]|nr:glutamine--fructose-6-phosphate aminotransferase [Bacillota bacterium]
IAMDGQRDYSQAADEVLLIPPTHPMLAPLLTALPMQMMAYYAASARGHDVDKPRNLAKSVTVE